MEKIFIEKVMVEIFRLLKEVGALSLEEIQESLLFSPRYIKKALENLCSKNLVVVNDKDGKYALNPPKVLSDDIFIPP